MESDDVMSCPFCGWEAPDGEYAMLLVRPSALGQPSAFLCSIVTCPDHLPFKTRHLPSRSS